MNTGDKIIPIYERYVTDETKCMDTPSCFLAVCIKRNNIHDFFLAFLEKIQ